MIALRSFLAIMAMFSGPLAIVFLGLTGNLKFSSSAVIVILVINTLISLAIVIPRLVQAGFTGLGGRNFYEEICVSLFENSGDANVIIADGKFVECNPATVKQLKCARKEEALSIHPSQISPEYQPDGQRSDEKANKMIGAALSQGFNRFEWLHVRKNGEKFPVVVTLVPSIVAGSQVVLVYWHDIADLNQSRESQKKIHDEQRKALQQIAGDFEVGVKSVVDSVSEAVDHLRNNAKGLSATAGEANERSAAVAGASEQASMNVERVAGASEELSATVRNIGHHVNESSSIAASAVQEALRTNQTVAGLTEAAQKIGDVVKLINDIASQTNLLALNATIEAARAGDAGKGFAVVAGEVKNLANQTARATEEIQGQVAQMQSVTATVVDAIKTISGTIDRMNNITQTITGMVEEQSKAANEISRNIQDTALRTRDVSDNIGTVSQAAGETGQLANGLMLEADALAAQANRLHEQVNNFMRRVRSA